MSRRFRLSWSLRAVAVVLLIGAALAVRAQQPGVSDPGRWEATIKKFEEQEEGQCVDARVHRQAQGPRLRGRGFAHARCRWQATPRALRAGRTAPDGRRVQALDRGAATAPALTPEGVPSVAASTQPESDL